MADVEVQTENKEEVQEEKKDDLMVVEEYSEKSFVVKGDATRKYKDQLKALGGRFNSRLKIGKAWIFSKTKQEQVVEFVQKANAGEISNTSNFNGTELPTVPRPSASSYQMIKFKIFKPKEGMNVKMTVNGKTMEGKVLKTESSTRSDAIDTAYLDFGEQTCLGVICRSKWQIYGYAVDHTIFFSE